MKQGMKNHIAGELHKVKGNVKEAVSQGTNIPDLAAKGKTKSRAGKIRQNARKAAEIVDGAAAAGQIRIITSKKMPMSMASGIARWLKPFGAWSKALLSSLLRMAGSFFSYLGSGILSISISRFYKRRSPQAA